MASTDAASSSPAAVAPAGAAAAAAAPAHARIPYPDLRALDPAVRLRGTVVKGFGRGSKELGVPTANLDPEALGSSLEGVPPGVYFGWASVGVSGEVYKMVMSIGWNPFYGNKSKTVEPHLLHSFPEDFYGQELRLLVTGYLRPELNFTSLDALIAAIRSDIDTAREELDAEAQKKLVGDAALVPTTKA